MVLFDLFFTSAGLFTQPRDAANRAPVCFPAQSSYNTQLAATRALGRGS